MTFRVLHVCTGNICRSPMAEHLMRAGLHERLGVDADRFVVESAGTWGHTGSPMEPYALSTLASYDVDGAAFSARELVAEHVVAADLILGATREHRAAAVDATALPTGDPVERAKALVKAAAANRGLVPPDSARDDDLDDPYQAPASAFATCGALVQSTLEGPLDLLAP